MPKTNKSSTKIKLKLSFSSILAIIGTLVLIVGLYLTIRPKAQPVGINEITINPITAPAVCGQGVKFLVRNQCTNTANFKTAEINCSAGGLMTIHSTTCASVASLFNQAYAKCSKICLTPSPTPVPSAPTPKPSLYPSPTSTTRPSPSPTPRPTSTVLPSPTIVP